MLYTRGFITINFQRNKSLSHQHQRFPYSNTSAQLFLFMKTYDFKIALLLFQTQLILVK